MILSMKLISIAFDMDEDIQNETKGGIRAVPSFSEYFGYALCPGTTVLGPWVSYNDYLEIYKDPKWVSGRSNFWIIFAIIQCFPSRILIGY